MKKIYRDFDHYWTQGDHGWSSASLDIAKEEWDRFEPTITASRDDYKQMYVELCKEVADGRSMYLEALREYIELYKKDDAPKFPRWWSNKMRIKDESN